MLNIREQKQTKGYPKRIPLFLLVGKTIQCYTEHEFDAKSAAGSEKQPGFVSIRGHVLQGTRQNGEKKMTREEFEQLAGAGVILLDGATGSNLTKAGMPKGVSTELWVLEHPDILANLQKAYVEAGSQIVYARPLVQTD